MQEAIMKINCDFHRRNPIIVATVPYTVLRVVRTHTELYLRTQLLKDEKRELG